MNAVALVGALSIMIVLAVARDYVRGNFRGELGKFDKTSQIVWGVVLCAFIALFVFLWWVMHSTG